MERNEALQIIKKHLPEKRYIHTLGVLDTALQLARKYGSDLGQTELAAIFHDYAKYRPHEEMRRVIVESSLPKQLLDFHPELWHAPVGAILVQRELGIDDEGILNAIKYHTTGRPGMTVLEKVIFLADYIEPNRSFPGVEQVRELAERNLDLAVFQALQNTIIHLVENRVSVYPDTVHTYNDFVKRIFVSQ
ncbi:bis(5'-nucleosyl)-tetraphosphatase (symmetrical) YqeK [Fervidibacillus halotolerans]|uniref:bis(5'-nucleosyl)-tetraphosphatase (symmetrical) n=1 Tax=Fervidibacillus halotolerans TaxID=2980027 RepID=A0A9E8LYC3_9BACI|nr:bis(5'-nucleosyl)-tetraphosphatase (symmetrical) YqeK [Fervidibacillus halotolerans]WAA11525.1 bis(5'-nucleosyl)-tetraphosphatase (symmetrical) YqeK [Fervidibacillus halotolerans]